MPRRRVLTQAEVESIRDLTFKEAAKLCHVGWPVWRAAKLTGSLPLFREALRADRGFEARVLASVREAPHLNTTDRARELHVGSATLPRFLVERELSKLNARLTFAGYRVEAVRPLQVARLRRIVATYPGSLTQLDYKTFGYLRSARGENHRVTERLGGYVVIDSLTSYAQLHLSRTEDSIEAGQAITRYLETAPFKVEGLLLTDSAKSFLSTGFQELVTKAGLLHRTIRSSHPWSNGKVEAMNKTLKYQCFAAIAGNVCDWQSAVLLVDRWMDYYNRLRSHNGHTNKGLPPLALLDLYQKTSGSHLEKLVKLGVIKLDDEWSVRLMGAGSPDLKSDLGVDQLPYALVCERAGAPPVFDADLRESGEIGASDPVQGSARQLDLCK